MVLSLRNRLKILIYFGAGVVLLVSLFDEGPEAGLTIDRLTIADAVLFALISVFDRLVWRLWFVPRLLKTGPVLRGTWKGVIRPTGDAATEIPAFFSIRQTFSGISLRLLTDESISDSSTAQLTQHADGLAEVEYAYQNTPKDAHRSESPIHYGAGRLECVGANPKRLEGFYFTSRHTSGDLEFTEHRAKITHAFADAAELFEN